MTILVTGGAGFIGANFVLDWLAATSEPVVNLDKLSYAGNLESLASLQNLSSSPRLMSVSFWRKSQLIRNLIQLERRIQK